MSLLKILSIWLTSHFKNGVAKTAVTNEKKNKLIHIAGGNAVIFVEKGQSLKMNKIHSINYLFAFFSSNYIRYMCISYNSGFFLK